MQDYEVVKTDQGHVVHVGGKYYKVPDSARLMPPADLRILFEGVKNQTPIAGTIERADVTATFLHGEDANKGAAAQRAKDEAQRGANPRQTADVKNQTASNEQNQQNRLGATPAPAPGDAPAPYQGRRRWRPTEPTPGTAPANVV